MKVQVNSDSNIQGRESLAAHVSGVVESALDHIGGHITRVEVHLSDENSHKASDDDKRCVMEARLEGRQPVAVTHQAATLEQAVNGAARKLARKVEGTLGRQRAQRKRPASPEPLP
ncbi:MAG: HPF/RaiA family ribosome-associated protein [Chromatiales bacterium]|nr:HPF/RaiA family ribosome-associated protein [Chromatiales bacterium]